MTAGSKPMTVMGIDPGLKGGIAWMGGSHPLDFEKMPVIKSGTGSSYIDFDAVAQILKDVDPYIVVIEKVHAMPKQGVTSVFTFGMGYGGLLGICAALGLRRELVTPQTWQKEILGGIDQKLGKARSLIWCRQSYPRANWNHRSDGIADAVCLAEYGCRKFVFAQS